MCRAGSTWTPGLRGPGGGTQLLLEHPLESGLEGSTLASGLELGGILGDWRGRRGKMVTGGREAKGFGIGPGGVISFKYYLVSRMDGS